MDLDKEELKATRKQYEKNIIIYDLIKSIRDLAKNIDMTNLEYTVAIQPNTIAKFTDKEIAMKEVEFIKIPIHEEVAKEIMKSANYMVRDIERLEKIENNSISKDKIREKILNPIQVEKQKAYHCFMNKKMSDDFVIDGTVLQELSYIEALVQELLNT